MTLNKKGILDSIKRIWLILRSLIQFIWENVLIEILASKSSVLPCALINRSLSIQRPLFLRPFVTHFAMLTTLDSILLNLSRCSDTCRASGAAPPPPFMIPPPKWHIPNYFCFFFLPSTRFCLFLLQFDKLTILECNKKVQRNKQIWSTINAVKK